MKKILPYILILSFVLPFFVSFRPLVVRADTSSVSDNFGDSLENLYKDSIGSFGIVASPEFWEDTSDSIWDLICQYYAWPFVSKENTLLQLQNNNITPDQVLNDTLNYVLVAIEEQLPYYVYHTLSIDKFFTFYDFSNYVDTNLDSYKTALNSIVSDSDNIYFLSQVGRDMNAFFETELSSVSLNYLENQALILYDGVFSVFPDYPYQSIVVRTGDTLPTYNLSGRLKFYNGISFVDTSDIDQWRSTTTSGGSRFGSYVKRSAVSSVGLPVSDLEFKCGAVNDSVGYWANSSFRGTAFLSVGGTVELLVFKSGAAMNSFYAGNSKFYRFDSDYDLSKYPGIDYDKLFQIISENLDKVSGSLADQLNDIVNDYLKKEIELLGDIKDSLRDPTGYSWLRRIYELLNDKLDKKLSELTFPSSPGGGSSPGGSIDLGHTNEILSDIYDRLGLLIGPYDDGTISEPTFQTMVSEMSTRMPFSILTDIVVLCTLFSRTPVRPDFQIPIPFNPGETFTIDLSSFEFARPYINGFFILIFIVGLLAITTKIFDSLKG